MELVSTSNHFVYRGRLARPATPDAIPARIRLMEASPYWAV